MTDLRYALRTLARQPAYPLSTVTTPTRAGLRMEQPS